MPLFDPSSFIAEALDLVIVVGDDENRHIVLIYERHNPVFALFLEHEIAD